MDSRNVMTAGELPYSEQAFWMLKSAFVLAPLLAGIDKYFNFLTEWTNYLAPIFPRMLGITPEMFMHGVGLIEIVAGIGVLLRPRIFSYIVSLWMVGIIANLLILGSYYDVALRDLGLAIGAYALGQLSILHEQQVERTRKVISSRRQAA